LTIDNTTVKQKNNIYYYIAGLILVASVFIFFLFYMTVAGRERKLNLAVIGKINKLKTVQGNIAKNIDEVKDIKVTALRYEHSLNENSEYFASGIAGASKKYKIKLNYVKFIRINKSKDINRYSFEIAGHGKPANIYLFIKMLEFNYNIILEKFTITKSRRNTDYASFKSDLFVYAIKKTIVLRSIEKLKGNPVPPPERAGMINPFVYVAPVEKPVKKIGKHIVIYKKSVTKSAYKKISIILHESKPEESDAYNKKGVLLFLRGDFNGAMAFFKHAIALNPHNYKALSNAALDNYERKDYNDSIFYAKKALRQKELWQINFILGLAYLRNKNFSASLYYFKKSSRLNPLNDKIKYYLNIARNKR